MKISVLGMGYVGSVTAACLADRGHSVVGVDVNGEKVAAINAGRPPVLEAKLDEIVAQAVKAGRLSATTDCNEALAATDISLVCVGTPNMRNGRLDLSGVEAVSQEMGRALRHKPGFHTIAIRSTILPGTTDDVVVPILEGESGKSAGRDFGICYNPEFMREGSAVADFDTPPFTVIGARRPEDGRMLAELYGTVKAPMVQTDLRLAEMLKYVCNAFHALKIAFANEIGALASSVGIEPQELMEAFAGDSKLNISKAYLKPGFAFGGSCLPKDLRAMVYHAKQHDLDLPLLASILPSNELHLRRGLESILALGKKRIGILGLSFKAGTDDLRESPMIPLVKTLLGEGLQVAIYDPQVKMSAIVGANRRYIEETIPHIGALLSSSLDEIIEHSEVLVIGQAGYDPATIEKRLRPEQTLVSLVKPRAQAPHAIASAAAH